MKKRFNAIDLFCGCGGLSLGFEQAGFNIVMGIDFNEPAIKTFNNHFGANKGICANLLNYSESDLIKEKISKEKIDVIIGGPPCQGFSAANRWGDNNNDERNKLFFEYVKFVDFFKPRVVVIENVRQIVTNNKGYAKDQIYKIFESRGYTVTHCILKAEEYGVPQNRRRNFFVAIKGTKPFDFDSLKKQKLVTVGEAISDLYNFEPNETGEYIGLEPDNDYLVYARDSKFIENHYIKYPSKSTQEKMAYVPQGGNWENIPPKLFKTIRNNRHSSAYRRLREDEPSVTIDTGNAHSNYYHPLFNRIPTVREAARLQSFPDSFVFCGSKTDQYRQVGNAVPPLLAKALASAILEVLKDEE